MVHFSAIFSLAVAAATLQGALAATPAEIKDYLDGHNLVRRDHGAAALTWSDALASVAQTWVKACNFQHSGGTLGSYGENLAAGTNLGVRAAIKSWTDEGSQYDPNAPQPSHFTQVVWKATTQIGCAVRTCITIFPNNVPAQFYACEYNPPGNVIGRFPQNVQK